MLRWLIIVASLAGVICSPASASNVLDDPDLEAAADYLQATPKAGALGLMVAAASAEGQWVFVNARGERATAADAGEVAKVLEFLEPEFSAKPEAGFTFLLTLKTAAERRAFLAELPAGANFQLFFQGGSLALTLGEGQPPELSHASAGGLTVPIHTASQFAGTEAFLNREIPRGGVRLLALEPGAARFLPGRRPREAEDQTLSAEAIDPYKARDVFRSIAGGTAIVTGAIDSGLLHFQPATGNEQTVIVDDLEQAAIDADIDLLIIDTGTPRQPGASNMLWQTAALARGSEVLASRRMQDLLAALSSGAGALRVEMTEPASSEVWRFVLTPGQGQGTFGGMIGAVTGELTPVAIRVSARTSGRIAELDRRLLPGIQSEVQFAYLGLFGLGLLGWPVALGWWRRYGFQGIAGGIVFVLAFVPLVSPAAVIGRMLAVLRS